MIESTKGPSWWYSVPVLEPFARFWINLTEKCPGVSLLFSKNEHPHEGLCVVELELSCDHGPQATPDDSEGFCFQRNVVQMSTFQEMSTYSNCDTAEFSVFCEVSRTDQVLGA